MREFLVNVPKEPGSLAKLTEALAHDGVNIKALTSGLGQIRVITEDIVTTKAALEKTGFTHEESEIIPVKLIDRAGELSKVAKRLSLLNVNINSIYLLGTSGGFTTIALNVSDVEKARKALK